MKVIFSILIIAFFLFLILLTFFISENQNSLSVEIFKGFLLSAAAGLTGKFIWDRIKSPKLVAYSTKPSMQPLPLGVQRSFYPITIKNESKQFITQEAATHSRVKMTFMDTSKKELFSLSAKWNWTPQPLKYQMFNFIIREIPDPSLIPISEFVDINPHDEESFCIVMKYVGEDECYAFNGSSYLYPRLKNPAWKLDKGNYLIKVDLHSSNCHETYYFKLINSGNKLSDISIKKIN